MLFRSQVNDQRISLLQRQQVISALSAGGQAFHILSTDAAPQATGVLVQEPGSERSILIVAGLPRLPSGMGYQVWRITDESAVPLDAGILSSADSDLLVVVTSATFGVTNGDTQVLIVSDTFSATDAIGVSVEPAEGSIAPTGDIVLLGKL